jgi:hypothetical protein
MGSVPNELTYNQEFKGPGQVLMKTKIIDLHYSILRILQAGVRKTKR